MAESSPLLENFSYSIGFLHVIIGRPLVLTEHTIVVVLLRLARFNLKRLWVVSNSCARIQPSHSALSSLAAARGRTYSRRAWSP